MAEWKKVIVSGSTADLANVQNAGIAANEVVVGAGAGANQTGKALTAGQVLMGNASAVPTGTTISGDITLTNAGVAAIANDSIKTTMLSGSVADVPAEGDVVKVGANGVFTFSPASSTLSAGKGITITNNQISSSIYNDNGQPNSYGTAGGTGTTFTGSFLGDGSGLTGVTGEWDGSLNGDAEITGSYIQKSGSFEVELQNLASSGTNFDVSIYKNDGEAQPSTFDALSVKSPGGNNVYVHVGDSGSANGGLSAFANNAATWYLFNRPDITDNNNVLSLSNFNTGGGIARSASIQPALDADDGTERTIDLGASNKRFRKIFAAAFTGSFSGSLAGNANSATVATTAGSATNATNATNTTNVITAADSSDAEAFLTFGNAAAATQQLKTNSNIKANLTNGAITASGGFKGSLDGNAATATTATTANQLATNATGTNLVLSGDLTVQGTTTEIQTNNLQVRDQLILLNSGSTVSKATGIVFGGATTAGNSGTAGSGAVFFHDNTTKRLSFASGSVASSATSVDADAHIPLVTTGSHESINQIGNFKVDAAGEFYVYA